MLIGQEDRCQHNEICYAVLHNQPEHPSMDRSMLTITRKKSNSALSSPKFRNISFLDRCPPTLLDHFNNHFVLQIKARMILSQVLIDSRSYTAVHQSVIEFRQATKTCRDVEQRRYFALGSETARRGGQTLRARGRVLEDVKEL